MADSSQSSRQQAYTISEPYSGRDQHFTGISQIERQQQQTNLKDNLPDQLNFIPNAMLGIIGSIYCLLILCILLVIPIIEIAIGGAYRNQCPINSNIPVYLIVAGVCGVITIALTLVIVGAFICMFKGDSSTGIVASACVIIVIFLIIFLMSIFLFIWFIVGNVWIFGAKKDVIYDDPSSPNYCHRTLYEFAFTILILSYVMTAISCVSSCVRSCMQNAKNKN